MEEEKESDLDIKLVEPPDYFITKHIFDINFH